MSNFWRGLNISLINCEVNMFLTWSANCVITSAETQKVKAVQGDSPAVFDDSPTNDTKLYVPAVTFLKEDDSA